MDNYKFGNMLCTLREEHNLTQREFAKLIDVSDKAVSKWENGQAVPRMDTFEKIAQVLDTTVEELIIASKDNIKRIFVKNEFGTTLHVEIDGDITSFKADDDEKWIIIDSEKTSHKVVVYGEIKVGEIVDEIEPENTIKGKLAHKGIKVMSKWVDKQLNRSIIRAKCYYTLSNVSDDEVIEISNEMFSAGDKMWIFKDLDFSYPKLSCNANVELVNAECMNKTDALADFRRCALTSELGISIPFMLLAYPFRKMYFKSVLTSKGLMKYLNKADFYVAKNDKQRKKNEKRKFPILKGIGILILFVVAMFGIEIGFGILNVDSGKPYLVSADFSTVTYGREEYKQIDDLPKDILPETFLGAQVWTDARIDGKSKYDQYFEENKVIEYTDKNGDSYLWLVLNYGDFDVWEYDSFTGESYVYKLEK